MEYWKAFPRPFRVPATFSPPNHKVRGLAGWLSLPCRPASILCDPPSTLPLFPASVYHIAPCLSCRIALRQQHRHAPYPSYFLPVFSLLPPPPPELPPPAPPRPLLEASCLLLSLLLLSSLLLLEPARNAAMSKPPIGLAPGCGPASRLFIGLLFWRSSNSARVSGSTARVRVVREDGGGQPRARSVEHRHHYGRTLA